MRAVHCRHLHHVAVGMIVMVTVRFRRLGAHRTFRMESNEFSSAEEETALYDDDDAFPTKDLKIRSELHEKLQRKTVLSVRNCYKAEPL